MQAASTIRRARQRSGLGLRELARRAGTSHATLRAYETGAKEPRVDTVARVVAAAGFTLEVELLADVAAPDRVARGEELQSVLDLAAQFPARHAAQMDAPIFGRVR